VNGSTTVTAGAIEPLAPGAFGEGEVLDGEAVSSALKSLFSQHKLSKRVRLGIGNQRVVVRTVRLPAMVRCSQRRSYLFSMNCRASSSSNSGCDGGLSGDR